MILVVFVILLALFVVLPLVGFLVWTLISVAITGIVLGGLARLVIPGRQPIGALATIVAGWIGGLIGSGIAAVAFHHHHHYWLAKVLIEIAVSVVVVLAFSAGARNNPRLQGRGKGSGGHKIIDI
jgi:uncharacterized membrane protein YeaQ/YmgE (transglycosylase-associated protein family)